MQDEPREVVIGLIERFYSQVWNRWDEQAARNLLDASLTFRGSLGRRTMGVEEFLRYVAEVRAAFPDFHNHVHDVLVDGDQAVARLTYTGTHRGAVLGHAPTGNRVEYQGIAWFRVREQRIVESLVLGDVDTLRAQLGASDPG